MIPLVFYVYFNAEYYFNYLLVVYSISLQPYAFFLILLLLFMHYYFHLHSLNLDYFFFYLNFFFLVCFLLECFPSVLPAFLLWFCCVLYKKKYFCMNIFVLFKVNLLFSYSFNWVSPVNKNIHWKIYFFNVFCSLQFCSIPLVRCPSSSHTLKHSLLNFTSNWKMVRKIFNTKIHHIT